MDKKHILFICSHNSCRSQIAEGLINQICPSSYQAFSAGIEKTVVHPLAIKVMDEIDIDISNHYSKLLDEFTGKTFDYVVTVCDQAKETCPFFPGKEVIHQSFQDPASITGSTEEKLEAFRKTRDDIKQWLKETFCER